MGLDRRLRSRQSQSTTAICGPEPGGKRRHVNHTQSELEDDRSLPITCIGRKSPDRPSHPRPASPKLVVSFIQDLIAGELGLKVDRRRAPVEFLASDRADRTPTEN